MQIRLLLLPLLASLFALHANAQTPERSTSNTCFGEGPSHVDIKPGLAIIEIACTELVGKYMAQDQRFTCAWGTSLMKFDFAVRNLNVVPRSVSTDDCFNGTTYVQQKYCGELGGRQTSNKIMLLADPNNGQCSGFTTPSQPSKPTCPASFWKFSSFRQRTTTSKRRWFGG